MDNPLVMSNKYIGGSFMGMGIVGKIKYKGIYYEKCKKCKCKRCDCIGIE